MSLTVLVRGLGVENLKRARQALESLAGALTSRATDSLRVSVVSALPESPFNLSRVAGTSLTARDWSLDFARLQNIDVALSSRASESTLSAIAGALATRATDKLRVSVVDVLPESPFNLAKVGGVALTGRDWSSDFARLQNLDVPLSSRASESTLGTVASLVTGLSALDYDIISLDLSTARTDELIASNVVFLKILESTPSTAQYTLKLFSTTKKTITQDIAPPGTAFERLRRASVYVSNPAQSTGTKLDLFVFMG
ncbi:MAG: hypothetical protein LM558_01680 [Thermosphaera sp.]|nr:hypothetical protein [Thermosphaera sp.]